MSPLFPFLFPFFSPVPAPATASCPADMRLVEGDHYDLVTHDCVREKDGSCAEFTPDVWHHAGRLDHVRTCMDVYEAPNVRGEKPIVMLSSVQAEQWCADRGKRLCSEFEWETACEGPEHRPWAYGWTRDDTACNSDKHWVPFDAVKLMAGGEKAKVETDRLWQGEPSGSRDACVSGTGVVDMNGNVEEWVRSSRPLWQWPTVLMGGFWAKAWTQCRGTNAAHEPTFRFYEVGFRCCADPK